MGQTGREKEELRKAQVRLRRIQHYEQVTHNVSRTCRFFGISRGQFYFWLRRYRQVGFEGLKAQRCGPRRHPFATPPHIQALVLQVRQEPRYGPIRICLFLQRYHQVYVSVATIYKILRRHHVPRVSCKRYRPGPRRRGELTVPGQSVQVDVKHLKRGGRRFYQFTAIDEATRYRVLKIYAHSSIPTAIAFIDEVRQRLPLAIQRVQTDHGNEFGTDFTWHFRDLGIGHRHIPPGCPETNGKVERSHRTDEAGGGSNRIRDPCFGLERAETRAATARTYEPVATAGCHRASEWVRAPIRAEQTSGCTSGTNSVRDPAGRPRLTSSRPSTGLALPRFAAVPIGPPWSAHRGERRARVRPSGQDGAIVLPTAPWQLSRGV